MRAVIHICIFCEIYMIYIPSTKYKRLQTGKPTQWRVPSISCTMLVCQEGSCASRRRKSATEVRDGSQPRAATSCQGGLGFRACGDFA